MQLYVVYMLGNLNFNDYCKGVYSNFEDATVACIGYEKGVSRSYWRPTGRKRNIWKNQNNYCTIVAITVEPVSDKVWLIFHSNQRFSTMCCGTEGEAQNYIHNDMVDPDDWTEISKNHWVSGMDDIFIERFDIIYETVIKGAIEKDEY
jgi:hypothetical protein